MFLSLYRKTLALSSYGATLRANLQLRSSCGYIRKKELDEIEKQYGTSTYEQMKMYTKQAQLIYKQGWAALKQDFHTYRSLKQKQQQKGSVLSREEERLKKRMWQEMTGLKNLVIIQILPFSGPLLIYYIYVYPTSIPSWFSVDTLHENYQKQCIQTQQETVQHFLKHPLNTWNFKLSHLSSEQLKKLSDLLFGHHQDGLTGYNKLMYPKRKQYLIHPSFSKYLLIRNIKKQFQQEKYHQPELHSKSTEELIIEKYNRIMKGQERIVFEPVHDHQLTENIDCQSKKEGKEGKNKFKNGQK